MAEEEKKDEEGASETGSLDAVPVSGNGKKKLILLVTVIALLLSIGGAAFYFWGYSGKNVAPTSTQKELLAKEAFEFKIKNTRYVVVPDLLINLRNNQADGSTVYMRLSVVLEVIGISDYTAIQEMMPQIVNQYQIYLRGLSVDDIKGTEGLERLRLQLLQRVNRLIDPIHVENVLIKELLIQ